MCAQLLKDQLAALPCTECGLGQVLTSPFDTAPPTAPLGMLPAHLLLAARARARPWTGEFGSWSEVFSRAGRTSQTRARECHAVVRERRAPIVTSVHFRAPVM